MSRPFEFIGCATAAVLTVIQTNEIFQLVSLILTCLATAAALAFTIYKWYKMAKADGKIDEKELEQLGEILEDGAQEIKKITESTKEVSEKSEGDKK